MTQTDRALLILALTPLGWAAAIALIYRQPRRRRGGQRLVANPPKIRTQTTIPSPPPRGKQDRTTDERAGRTRTGE